MTSAIWSPPTITSARRLALSVHVRAAVEKLRPDVLCAPDVGFGEHLSGLGSYTHCTEAPGDSGSAAEFKGVRCPRCFSAPRLIVSASDPAIRAVWEAAQRGELVEATDLARFLYNDRVIWHAKHGSDPWLGLCRNGEDRTRATEGRVVPASWAIAVAAGAGAWSRDAEGRFNAPFLAGELTERIFPAWFMSEIKPGEDFTCAPDLATVLRGWRPRAEAADAWACEHVASIGEDAETVAFGALAGRGAGTLVVLDLVDVEAAKRIAVRAIENGAAALCFATDETIDSYAPPVIGAEIEVPNAPIYDERAGAWGKVYRADRESIAFEFADGGVLSRTSLNHGRDSGALRWRRRHAGLTFSRQDDGNWIGRSFTP